MPDFLFLAHRIPYPPDRGDKIRSWHMLAALGALGTVHLACFADDAADARHLPALREAMGGRLGEAHVEVRRSGRIRPALEAFSAGKPISLTLFDSAAMRQWVEGLLARRDIETVFAFSVQMAQFVPSSGPRFVMDFVDVDSAKFADYAAAGGPLGWLHRREARLLGRFERAVAERADASLFVSEAEAGLFRDRAGPVAVRAVGNGVDLEHFRPGAAPPPTTAEGPILLFTGQMDYRPNVEAVSHFAGHVLPLIRAERPDVRFVIAGRRPTAAVRRLASDHVLVTGAVEDMRCWLEAADVVVAPLRIGRGVQNKVLEAMAMARPVVASAAAFTGIEAEAGRDLLVEDSDEGQAAAILSLLRDPARARAIGEAARACVERSYSWASRLAPLPGLVGVPAAQAAA